ncbi:MAG: hypothetical protein IPG07_15450 [Crocinitomicaceae bacterium]|nr:hypothetical protein [Crocinitomicaceae bacterium]
MKRLIILFSVVILSSCSRERCPHHFDPLIHGLDTNLINHDFFCVSGDDTLLLTKDYGPIIDNVDTLIKGPGGGHDCQVGFSIGYILELDNDERELISFTFWGDAKDTSKYIFDCRLGLCYDLKFQAELFSDVNTTFVAPNERKAELFIHEVIIEKGYFNFLDSTGRTLGVFNINDN